MTTSVTSSRIAVGRSWQQKSWARLRPIAVPAMAIGCFLALYQFAVAGVLINETYLPKVPAIGSAIVDIVTGPNLARGIATTLGVAFSGFAIGALPALILGLVSGRSAVVYNAQRFTVDFMRTMPTVALIPLVVVLWGPTNSGRIFLVAFTVFWPIYLQTVYGVQDANPTAIDTARSYGLSRRAILFRVVFPSAAGYIATAFRIFIVLSVLVSVSSELILGGGTGLGGMVSGYAQAGNYPAVYGMDLIIGVVGMLTVFSVTRLERKLMFWHESHREER